MVMLAGVPGNADVASLPADATGILDLAHSRLAELRSWRMEVETRQSMSNMEVGIAGTLAVSSSECASANLRLNLPGVDMPNAVRVHLGRRMAWSEQTLFDQSVITFARLSAVGANGFDAVGQMIRAGGAMLQPIEPAETIWWLRRGWSLNDVSLAPPELPETVRLRGTVTSLAHAGEAFLHTWRASEARTLELYLDREQLHPRRIRVLDFQERVVLTIDIRQFEANPAEPVADCNVAPPEDVSTHDYTVRIRTAQEKRDRLRDAEGAPDERTTP